MSNSNALMPEQKNSNRFLSGSGTHHDILISSLKNTPVMRSKSKPNKKNLEKGDFVGYSS